MGYQSFDFRQQLAAAIRDISVLELKEAYGGLLADESRSLWLKTAESDQPNTAVDMRVGSDTYNYDF